MATIHATQGGWTVVYYNTATSNWQTYTGLTLTQAKRLASELVG